MTGVNLEGKPAELFTIYLVALGVVILNINAASIMLKLS